MPIQPVIPVIDINHILISDNKSLLNLDKITIQQAINNSICYGAYLDNKQIGFARLVTDKATFGYLCDVFTISKYRKQGVASKILHEIFAQDWVKNLRRTVLVTSNAHNTYRPLGFEDLSNPERYMELHRPLVYDQNQSSI